MSCQLLICTRRSMYRIMLVLKRTSASDFFFFFISRELFFITMLEEVRSRANGSGKINKLLQWIACECVHYHLDVTRTADSKKKKISATSQRSERVRSRCANSRLSPNVPHHHGTRLRAQERWNVLRQLGGWAVKSRLFFFFFLHKTRPKGCDQTQWARLGRCAWWPWCPQERKGPVSQRV